MWLGSGAIAIDKYAFPLVSPESEWRWLLFRPMLHCRPVRPVRPLSETVQCASGPKSVSSQKRPLKARNSKQFKFTKEMDDRPMIYSLFTDEFIKTCHIDDPNFEECSRESIQILFKRLAAGECATGDSNWPGMRKSFDSQASRASPKLKRLTRTS